MDERFYEGIREFNAGRYFEAHDILEDLWQGYREADRVFLQALIHSAVGLYHLENDNLKGARSQLSKACLKIEPYRPKYWGVRVDILYASLKDQLMILEESERGGEKGGKFPERPRIQLTSGNYLTNY
jgi:predicted metal-dependent hydrolase